MRFHSPHSQPQRNFCAASTLKPVQKGKRKIRFQTCGRMGSLWATALNSINILSKHVLHTWPKDSSSSHNVKCFDHIYHQPNFFSRIAQNPNRK
jgi:hypothetical protein